jgi:hypothetical protein
MSILEMYQRKELAGEVVEMYQNTMVMMFVQPAGEQESDCGRKDCKYHDVW